ncbi:hypothetical protein [Absidia glauca]|uniref:LAG1-DNAbind-domain-containing protein n=1 Tax=Absidia glauca TaxID=4829 RepID=A0A163MEW7_ABSGL|nr:hypothetical protein [Absidia glauca]
MSIPATNYYDPATTTATTAAATEATHTPTPSSFELTTNNNNSHKDSRKRKQRVSATEPYFATHYHWEAEQQISNTPPQHNKDWSSSAKASQPTFDHQQVDQSAFVFDSSFFHGYHQPYSSQPSGQQPYRQPYSHQLESPQQQTSDPLQSLLQSQDIDHRAFQSTWDTSLPSNHQSSSTSTTTSTHHHNNTTFSPDGFLDALSDERSTNNLIKFDQIAASLTTDKSAHPLSSHGLGNNNNSSSSDGSMMLLTSQHYPNSNTTTTTTTSGTPPSSPTTMPSTQSSPAIAPMYGRLSNLSLRQHQPNVPSMNNHHYQQQQSPSPTYGKQHNGGNDVDVMMTINERPMYESYASLAHPSNDLKLDYQPPLTPSRNLHAVAAARSIQQQATAAKLQPIIQQYLRSKDPMIMGEKTVVIMSSKVAQKSYGTEKRFLCPPPTAILVGSTWWSKKHPLDSPDSDQVFQEGQGDSITRVAPPKVTVCISGESSSQAGQIEWYSQVNAMVVGQTGSPQQSTHHDPSTSNNTRFKNQSMAETRSNVGNWYHNPRLDPVGGGRCVSKQLFINDADEKRKRVECLVKIQIHGQWMGTLAGKGIKVISKPSKKRQSVKNMELCIHHGSVVSLFNRIRSQTVSTKYLGVSNGTDSAFGFPGQPQTDQSKTNDGTCFVARTTSWDPFVIWLLDTSTAPPEQQQQQQGTTSSSHAEDYIGHRAFKPSVNYPPPPAIALRNTTQQPLAIHYNQHVVLQCLTTGLVSPVMIVRKVDKASTVVGGARSVEEPVLNNGGEYGDEILGDPVSQLHKIALQIVQDSSQASRQQQQQPYQPADLTTGLMEHMLPRFNSPVTYLACLNDMVGMHRSTEQRQPILKTPPPPPPHQPVSFAQEEIVEEGGRVVRKRKVSVYANQQPQLSPSILGMPDLYNDPTGFYGDRRRANSSDDYGLDQHHQLQGSASTSILTGGVHDNHWPTPPRSRSLSTQDHRRRTSTSSSSTSSWMNGPLGGAYWYEDVSDAAVWTLVGTDIASYTFLPPPPADDNDDDTLVPTVFPHLSHYTLLPDDVLHLHGDNLARDLQVWLGDVRVPHVEYKSRELMVCRLPPLHQLQECPFLESYQASAKMHYQLPFLLVKTVDGIVHKSSIFYQF